MIVISGWNSRVSTEFRKLLPSWEKAERGAPCEPNFDTYADRYLFCHGLLRAKQLEDQTQDEFQESMEVNCESVIRQCDRIFVHSPFARVCVIGSHSGFVGSYDGAYAIAKQKLHCYVEKKELEHPEQQLVGIAPSIIADAGMTTRREDTENLESKKNLHPKRRFLRSEEVARMAHFLLYQDKGYTSGTVIRMHGGGA